MDTHISKKDTTESPRPSQETELTLIDKYEEDYHTALAIIDNDVKELIQHGSEMKGLMLFAEQISKILEIHESLSTFYLAIYNRQEVLQHFGSEKLRQLGHDLRPIREALKGVDATEEEIEFCDSISDCLSNTDLCVLTTPWPDIVSIKADDIIRSMNTPMVFDCWREWKKLALDERVDYNAVGINADIR